MNTGYTIVSESHPAERAVKLLLNGKFGEDALPDLDRSISEARQAASQVLLDLSEVTLVDRKTVQFFSERTAPDVKIVNCPIYLRSWILQVSDETER